MVLVSASILLVVSIVKVFNSVSFRILDFWRFVYRREIRSYVYCFLLG